MIISFKNNGILRSKASGLLSDIHIHVTLFLSSLITIGTSHISRKILQRCFFPPITNKDS